MKGYVFIYQKQQDNTGDCLRLAEIQMPAPALQPTTSCPGSISTGIPTPTCSVPPLQTSSSWEDFSGCDDEQDESDQTNSTVESVEFQDRSIGKVAKRRRNSKIGRQTKMQRKKKAARYFYLVLTCKRPQVQTAALKEIYIGVFASVGHFSFLAPEINP